MTKNFASHKILAFYRRRSEIAQKTNINPQKFGLHCVLHRIISKPWKYVPKYLDAPLTKQYVKESLEICIFFSVWKIVKNQCIFCFQVAQQPLPLPPPPPPPRCSHNQYGQYDMGLSFNHTADYIDDQCDSLRLRPFAFLLAFPRASPRQPGLQQGGTGGMQGNPVMKAGLSWNCYCFSL